MAFQQTFSYDDWRRTNEKPAPEKKAPAKEKSSSPAPESEEEGREFTYIAMRDNYYPVYQPPQPQYVCYPNTGQPYAQYPYVQQYAQPYNYQHAQAGAAQQYACYPNTYQPTSYVRRTEPISYPSNAGKDVWVGRTRAQVEEDDRMIAAHEGVYQYNSMKPTDDDPGKLYWVCHVDASQSLHNLRTIDECMKPGRWERDDRYGNAYFIREDKKKE